MNFSSWAVARREELHARNIVLDYRLLRLRYLQLLNEHRDPDAAIEYAQTHFREFIPTQLEDIKILMGSLAFIDELEESPYADLFELHHWEEARDKLVEACCELNGIPSRSPLALG